MRIKRLSTNLTASGFFAPIAALILVLAVFSTAYISMIQQAHMQELMIIERNRGMKVAMIKAHMMVENALGVIALGCAEGLEYAGDILNITRERFSRYISNAFPMTIGGCNVYVNNFSLTIIPIKSSTLDITPYFGVKKDNMMGKNVLYPNTFCESGEGSVDYVVDYAVVGMINYSATAGEQRANIELPIEERLGTIAPFIRSKFSSFTYALSGGELADIIKYMITMLVQYRIIMGEREEARVICWKDVALATNMALALEAARHLRYIGHDFYQEFEEKYPPSKSLMKILRSYANRGVIDPADLLALYMGYDGDEIRVENMISQAMYAAIDQLILKYLDYLGINSIGNKIIGFVRNALQKLGIERTTILRGRDIGEGYVVRAIVRDERVVSINSTLALSNLGGYIEVLGKGHYLFHPMIEGEYALHANYKNMNAILGLDVENQSRSLTNNSLKIRVLDGNTTLSAGESVELGAFVNNTMVIADWHSNDSRISLSEGDGKVMATYSSALYGSGGAVKITAYNASYGYGTIILNLTPPSADGISVYSSQGCVENITLPVGGVIKLYTILINDSVGSIGECNATWEYCGDILDVRPEGTSATITAASKEYGTCKINVSFRDGKRLLSKELIVNVLSPTVDEIALSFMGSNVSLITLGVCQEAEVTALGYNHTAGYLGPINCTWNFSGDCISVAAKNSEAYIVAGRKGGWANLSAHYAKGDKEARLTIHVLSPTIDSISFGYGNNETIEYLSTSPDVPAELFVYGINKSAGVVCTVNASVYDDAGNILLVKEKNYSFVSQGKNAILTMPICIRSNHPVADTLPANPIYEVINKILEFFWEKATLNISFDYVSRNATVDIYIYDGEKNTHMATLTESHKNCRKSLTTTVEPTNYTLYMQINVSGDDAKIEIKNLTVSLQYSGFTVSDVSTGKTQTPDYAQCWDYQTASLCSDEVYPSVSDIVSVFVSDITDMVASVISETLFKNRNKPIVKINPNDSESYVEYTVGVAEYWLKQAVEAFISNLNKENLFKDFLKNILDIIANKILPGMRSAVLNALNTLGSWLENAKNAVVSKLCKSAKSAFKKVGGKIAEAADGLIHAVFKSIGHEEDYEELKECIKDYVNGLEDFWNDMRESIKSTLSTLKSKISKKIDEINSAIEKSTGEASSIISSWLISATKNILYMITEYLHFVWERMFLSHKVLSTKSLQYVIYWDKNKSSEYPYIFSKYGEEGELKKIVAKFSPINFTPVAKRPSSPQTLGKNEGIIWVSRGHGVHYTDPTTLTLSSPFETTWHITIIANFSAKAYASGYGCESAISDNETLVIDEDIVAYSGWPILGVDYEPSRTLTKDIWKALSKIWEKIMSVVRWILNILKVVVDIIVKLIKKLLEVGARILKELYQQIEKVFRSAMSAIGKGVSLVSRAILFFLKPGTASFTAFGMVFTIFVPEDKSMCRAVVEKQGMNLSFVLSNDGLRATMNYTGRIATVFLGMDTDAYENGERWLWGTALVAGRLKIDYEAGVFEEKSEEIGVESPTVHIPTPAPGVFIDMSGGISLVIDKKKLEKIKEAIVDSFSDTVHYIIDGIRNAKGIGDIASQIGEGIRALASKIEKIMDESTSIEIYFSVGVSGGTLAGLKGKIAVIISNAISTLAQIIEFVAKTVKSLIEYIINKIKSIIYAIPSCPPCLSLSPPNIMEKLGISFSLCGDVEIGGMERSVGISLCTPVKTIVSFFGSIAGAGEGGDKRMTISISEAKGEMAFGAIEETTSTTYFRAEFCW